MQTRTILAIILAALVIPVITPSAVFGQAESGSIVGTIRDSSGFPKSIMERISPGWDGYFFEAFVRSTKGAASLGIV